MDLKRKSVRRRGEERIGWGQGRGREGGWDPVEVYRGGQRGAGGINE
jgi:hypothetical protein